MLWYPALRVKKRPSFFSFFFLFGVTLTRKSAGAEDLVLVTKVSEFCIVSAFKEVVAELDTPLFILASFSPSTQVRPYLMSLQNMLVFTQDSPTSSYLCISEYSLPVSIYMVILSGDLVIFLFLVHIQLLDSVADKLREKYPNMRVDSLPANAER